MQYNMQVYKAMSSLIRVMDHCDAVIFEKLRFRCPHYNVKTSSSNVSTLESVFENDHKLAHVQMFDSILLSTFSAISDDAVPRFSPKPVRPLLPSCFWTKWMLW